VRRRKPTNANQENEGSNMYPMNSGDLDEMDLDETGVPRRANARAPWAQRRQAKQRSRARTSRRRATATAHNGMHMRRNKRMAW